MKNVNYLIVFIIFFFSANILAQPGPGGRGLAKGWKLKVDQLDLAGDQLKKIEEIRLSHQREMIDHQAQIKKEELNLRELQSNKFNRDQYVAAVDKISTMRQEMAVKRANHKMDVYELLTDKQKEIWNDMGNRGSSGKKGSKRCCNRF